MDLLAAFLKTVGAFETRHSGRTLGHHLLGTYALLKDAGCDEEVCLAGGLHSVYGTRRFKTKVCDPDTWDAQRIATLFGSDTQRLIYFFSIAESKEINDALEEERDPFLIAMALITAANILEQGGSLDRWPRISAAWEAQLARSHAEAPSDR